MAFVTKYGTYFGQLIQQTGRVIFVAASATYTVDGRSYSASDDNDGLSPERALRTLAYAYTQVNASAGEVIFLMEGTHSVTSTLRLQKAGISIIGVQSSTQAENVTSPFTHLGPKSVIDCTSAAAPGLSVEADNVEIGYVELRPASGFGGIIFRASSPDGFYIHDCRVNMAAGQGISLDTSGIDFGYRADVAGLTTRSQTRLTQITQRATAYIANMSFISGGANGPGILTATADVAVVGARFHTRAGAWATAFAVATGTGFVYIQGSSWTAQNAPTGMGIAVDGSGAGIINGKVMLSDCRFCPTLTGAPVDNFTPGVASAVECYQAVVFSSSGGGVQGGTSNAQATPYLVVPSN